ncbi:membrane protein YqaA, SNARE-associated domain [Thalassococcus halodurans]|jgi:membrane protein YqaA with SNARE-associated domain|uniref:Membrane protein YqaA, SNARE-associated domain n=1 Tax=Thalassococcus halodurans TaxID=373675 RepID=A0A1H5UFY9_9RHOB|nr:YqaA family protein [Thalassococcus halodurans]SEF73197.1 membrane protein YqaA, SNARE-associated domain [Thalassococcus halodurans]
MGDLTSLVSLFVAAFGAATILPFQSEVVFVAVQAAGTVPIWVMIAVSSFGNILGSVLNYFLGTFFERYRGRRWFPVSDSQIERARKWWRKYGVWTLLLSWAPLGDAFTVIAGIMRTPVWLFLLLVTIAKTGRFIILAWLTAQVV